MANNYLNRWNWSAQNIWIVAQYEFKAIECFQQKTHNGKTHASWLSFNKFIEAITNELGSQSVMWRNAREKPGQLTKVNE